MDLNRLKELKLASPFRPFFLLLHDGRRLFVEEAHRIGLALDGSRFGVSHADGVELLTLDKVRDVDVLVASTK
jgi:hypothetical protein